MAGIIYTGPCELFRHNGAPSGTTYVFSRVPTDILDEDIDFYEKKSDFTVTRGPVERINKHIERVLVNKTKYVPEIDIETEPEKELGDKISFREKITADMTVGDDYDCKKCDHKHWTSSKKGRKHLKYKR